MENTIDILNIISTITLTVIFIILTIKVFKLYELTKKKDIELKEEIKNYYKRKS